ncbi:MAG: TraB/GumN family protein, partial [Prevotella sp.]|nr:TraB/GumN family protein [Prevotella sp.]
TIKDYLTPDEFKRLDAFMIAKMGTGMSNPMVASKMGNFTPMALVTQFQLLLFMTKHMGEFDPSSTFDQYFQAQAKKNGLPCGGLETLKKQIEVLYTGKPISRQVEELMCFIDNESFNSQMMEDLTSAFYAQNLETLKQVMDRKLGGKCDSTPEEEAQLIYDRNADWVSKMPTIMASKPTFFAVGAAHLPGDKGVLQLLRNAGYTVEGVK